MKIKAAVVRHAGEPYTMENVELQAPKQGELLVRVHSCGICHTDEVAANQIIPVPLPAVFGHEGAGVVEALGEGVTEFAVGDRVGISFGFCGHCENCLTGKPYACENFNGINFGGVMADGTKRLSKNGEEISSFFGQSTFATYAVVNANSAIKVVDPTIDLGLIGPLGCGIQTGAGAVLNGIRPEFGSSIAVFGCGTVGMSAIMAAKIAGCAKIIAVGGNAKSLELAKELGATHTVNRHEISDLVGKIKTITKGGVHYAIDTTGVGDFVRKALNSTRPLGTAVVLGATGDLTINVQEELMGESKSLVGIVEGNAVPKIFIPKLLEYYKAGQFPMDKLITYFDFDQINEAVAASHGGDVIKAVVRM